MSEVQLSLFGFSPKLHARPKRNYRVEYAKRKERERNKEELLSRLCVLDFDCPFESPNDWSGLRSDRAVCGNTKDQGDSLHNISEEEVVYLHQAFMFKHLHFLGDNRVNMMLKQRIFETWLFVPLKPYWEEVDPFSFQACCRLYWDNVDPYEIQCLFIDSKSRKPNFNIFEYWDENEIPDEIKSVLTQPILNFAYPWNAPESATAHLDCLRLHEKAALSRHLLPSELFIEVIEWINRSGWTDDYRLIPFTFDACCKFAGVDPDEHRKCLIHQIRKLSNAI